MQSQICVPRHAAEPKDEPARMRMLGNTAMFSALPETTLKTLASAMTERQAACGETIFLQDEDGPALFGVLAGQVRLIISGVDGREHVLRCAGPGDIFGEIAVLDKKPRSAGAVAATNCKLLVLERRHLMAMMEQQPAIAIGLITVLCERLRASSAQVENLLFQRLPKRLAGVLLDLRADSPGRAIDITQAELGERTGASREWVNKTLRSWQAACLVSLQPGRVMVLEPALLQNFVDGSGAQMRFKN